MATETISFKQFQKKHHSRPVTFGKMLTAMRANLNLTQTELAKRLKVTRSMICDIEKGRVLTSIKLAAKIAKLAGFPEEYAVFCCLQEQIDKAGLKLRLEVYGV